MSRADKVAKFPIIELFGPTIQGEGIMTGTITHFLRTGGCGLRCDWCDSMHAVLPAEIKRNRTMMTIDQIVKSILELPAAPYLTLTGGDPCLHQHLGDLIVPLNLEGMRVAVETQGQEFPWWLEECDVITFSPKGPSSGNEVDPQEMVDWCIQLGKRRKGYICIKVVIFNQADFEYAMQVYDLLPYAYYDYFYFTAGTPLEIPNAPSDEVMSPLQRTVFVLENQRAVAERVLHRLRRARLNDKVHVGCQQHVLLWPEEDQGV